MAHGLSCSVACGIFPDQGSNPCPLHWQADPEPLRHQGSPNTSLFHADADERRLVEKCGLVQILEEVAIESILRPIL